MKLKKQAVLGLVMGAVMSFTSLSPVLAAGEPSVTATNCGIVFEDDDARGGLFSSSVLSVQFGGEAAKPYISMDDFINMLQLSEKFDTDKSAYVITNDGWSHKTPVSPINGTAVSMATPAPTIAPGTPVFPDMYTAPTPKPTPTPQPTPTPAPKAAPRTDANGYYDLSVSAFWEPNVDADFLAHYFSNASFNINDSSNWYSYSFYEDGTVMQYDGSQSVKTLKTGAYECQGQQVNLVFDKGYYLNDQKIPYAYENIYQYAYIKPLIKANSNDVNFYFLDQNGNQLSIVQFKKAGLKPLYQLGENPPFSAEGYTGEKVDNATVSSAGIIFLGSKLNLPQNAIITLDSESAGDTYFSAEDVLKAMGYYYCWDAVNGNVVFTRYANQIDPYIMRNNAKLAVGGMVLNPVSETYLTNHLTGTWECMSEDKKQYFRFVFSAGNRYEFVYKTYDSTDYQRDTGTYTCQDGGIRFQSEGSRKCNQYGEELTFGTMTLTGLRSASTVDGISALIIAVNTGGVGQVAFTKAE